MRKVSVYLHKDIIETLECFGPINIIVNELVRASINDDELYEQVLPPAPNRDGCRRLDLWIESNLIEELGNIRLRPLIYWFVENEKYNELGWEMVEEYGARNKTHTNMRLVKIIQEIRKLNLQCNNDLSTVISELERIKNIYET